MKTNITRSFILAFVLALLGFRVDSEVNNIAAAWTFNEGMGNTAGDSEGQGVNGTINGATWTTGVRDGALSFDGTDDYVAIPDHGAINITNGPWANRTVTAIFKVNDASIADRKQVIYKEGGRIRGFVIYVHGGELYVGAWNQAEYDWNGSWPSIPIESNRWYDVGLVIRDGKSAVEPDKFEMWLNGELIAKEPGGEMFNHSGDIGIGMVVNNTRFHDGSGAGTDSDHFKGIIDDVRVYNEALSEADFTLTIDTQPPVILGLSPSDDVVVTGLDLDTNLQIIFNEAVNAGTGFIILYKSDGTQVEQFDVTSSITGSGTTTITIDPANDLEIETDFYFQVDVTAFKDTAGNSHVGITDTTSWNFTTADATLPDIVSTSPSHNATNVSLDPPIVVTFTEPMSQQSLLQMGIKITVNDTGGGDDFQTPQFSLDELLDSGLATMTQSDTDGQHRITLDTNFSLPIKADISVELFLQSVLDLSGNPMVVPMHRTYEFQTSAAPAVDAQTGSFYVNPISGVDDASIDGGESASWKTITYALTRVVGTTTQPSVINLKPGTYSTLSGETFPLLFEDNVSLMGDNETNTIIDGRGENVSILTGDGVVGVTVSNLAVINTEGDLADNQTEGDLADNQSAIHLQNDSKLTLYQVLLSNHKNHQRGAAIRAKDSAVTFVQNWFSDNSAQSGGAIYLEHCDLLVRSNHFDANQSLDSITGQGGAMLITNNDQGASKGALEDNQFSNNIATKNGGALALKQSSLRIFHNLFIGNQAYNGGGIYVDTGTTDLPQMVENDLYRNSVSSSGDGAAIYNHADNASFSAANNYWGSSPQFTDLVSNVTYQPTASNSFFDLPPPTISQVSPARGVNTGSSPITITGDNFQSGVTAALGGQAASQVVVNSKKRITVDTPAGSSGSVVDLVVTNPDGKTATLSNAFLYLTATSASSLSLTSSSSSLLAGESLPVSLNLKNLTGNPAQTAIDTSLTLTTNRNSGRFGSHALATNQLQVQVSSGKFRLNSATAPTLQLVPGQSYLFDQSDSSNDGHPLGFS
ncbi:TPA: DUF1565 domain-containing protein, partial [Candidatus Poribacteria bacterium]|nr:DUF1565 domain-containing protein [Candidatus Poribacteria bacterium]